MVSVPLAPVVVAASLTPHFLSGVDRGRFCNMCLHQGHTKNQNHWPWWHPFAVPFLVYTYPRLRNNATMSQTNTIPGRTSVNLSFTTVTLRYRNSLPSSKIHMLLGSCVVSTTTAAAFLRQIGITTCYFFGCNMPNPHGTKTFRVHTRKKHVGCKINADWNVWRPYFGKIVGFILRNRWQLYYFVRYKHR